MAERGAILEGRARQEKRFIGVLRPKNQSSESKPMNPGDSKGSSVHSKSFKSDNAANPGSKRSKKQAHADRSASMRLSPRISRLAEHLHWNTIWSPCFSFLDACPDNTNIRDESNDHFDADHA